MRIGILRCGKVQSTLSAEYGEYPEMLENGFTAINPEFEFHTYYSDEGKLPESIDECDAYIISGSNHSVFDGEELWINQLRDFVVRLNKAAIKTIGISFGHQIMAEAMGGRVERADCGWKIGVHEGSISCTEEYMQPSAESLHIAMMCEDEIVALPEDAKVLAKSKSCDNLILQYNNHFLSTQGHPEFSQGFAKALINIRQDDFPSKRLEKGLASFADHDLDGSILFQWFTNFITPPSCGEESEIPVAI
ncbi:MAG: GMP synthase [Gammaproteobacteria bacterium]|nr:GMP synthase [Gammaproteobacteria bacterium]